MKERGSVEVIFDWLVYSFLTEICQIFIKIVRVPLQYFNMQNNFISIIYQYFNSLVIFSFHVVLDQVTFHEA